MTVCILELQPLLRKLVLNFLWELGHDVYTCSSDELEKDAHGKFGDTEVVIASISTLKNNLPQIFLRFDPIMFVVIRDTDARLSVAEAVKYRVFGYLDRAFSLHDLELMLIRIAERKLND